MDFSSTGAGGKLDSSKREEIMDQVKMQLALTYATQLLQKITDKCFQKCVPKPGYSLDSSEQKCVAMCMDRYLDSINIVSKTFTSRLQKESSSG